MKAVVLAGGQGTRLKGVIKDIPKPMAPIETRPFMEYIILQLRKAGISEIVISTGYRGEVIKSCFGNGKGLNLSISYSEEREPLGTGGAIKKALGMIQDKNVIAMNGDSFLEIDFEELISFHHEQNAITTMGLVPLENTGRYGAVKVNDKKEIVSFSEKGSHQKGFINGGVYIINRKLMDFIPEGQISLEKDVFPLLLGRRLYGLAINGFFVDIGVPEDYLKLRNDPDILNLILKETNTKSKN
jgi:D-glycero-alpha-D-manno-heptose 1-phosphate guanylyltransferase